MNPNPAIEDFRFSKCRLLCCCDVTMVNISGVGALRSQWHCYRGRFGMPFIIAGFIGANGFILWQDRHWPPMCQVGVTRCHAMAWHTCAAVYTNINCFSQQHMTAKKMCYFDLKMAWLVLVLGYPQPKYKSKPLKIIRCVSAFSPATNCLQEFTYPVSVFR